MDWLIGFMGAAAVTVIVIVLWAIVTSAQANKVGKDNE